MWYIVTRGVSSIITRKTGQQHVEDNPSVSVYIRRHPPICCSLDDMRYCTAMGEICCCAHDICVTEHHLHHDTSSTLEKPTHSRSREVEYTKSSPRRQAHSHGSQQTNPHMLDVRSASFSAEGSIRRPSSPASRQPSVSVVVVQRESRDAKRAGKERESAL